VYDSILPENGIKFPIDKADEMVQQSQVYSTISVRIPSDLHARSTTVAKISGKSLNALIVEALERIVSEEEERRLFDAFTELGQDREMSDVEFLFTAQAEVALYD
jgi:predicted DNA-binding protein